MGNQFELENQTNENKINKKDLKLVQTLKNSFGTVLLFEDVLN